MEKQTSDQEAQIKNAEISKQVKIKKIIDCGFAEDKTFSIFHKNNAHNYTELNALLNKLVSESQSAIELIKDLERLSEVTFYRYNRIIHPSKDSDSDILFCCSAISPRPRPKKNQSAAFLGCAANTAALHKLKLLRLIKRANCKSCPMRLKFKFDTYSSKYQISEDDSNFNHNHSADSDSSEVIIGFFYKANKL